MTNKIGQGDMYKAPNVSRNMEKMFLPWLEGRSGGCEVRRALTPIHLSPFISLLRFPTPFLSLSPTRDTHTHRSKMFHLNMCACAVVERGRERTATVIKDESNLCMNVHAGLFLKA